MENTTRKKVALTYRQWMALVNYISNRICGVTVGCLADFDWRDLYECASETQTVSNWISDAENVFGDFLLECEPSHYREMYPEIGKVAKALKKDTEYLGRVLELSTR